MIQDDDGDAYKVNGQRLKLFLDHNKALDEEINVIDLVDHMFKYAPQRKIAKAPRESQATDSTRAAGKAVLQMAPLVHSCHG